MGVSTKLNISSNDAHGGIVASNVFPEIGNNLDNMKGRTQQYIGEIQRISLQSKCNRKDAQTSHSAVSSKYWTS